MKDKTEIGRRQFLLAAGSFTALAASTVSHASADSGHAHHHHNSKENDALTRFAAHCETTGNACINHCLILLGDGDTEMADCAGSVQLMKPVCEAVAYHAAADSSYLKELVSVCKTVCADCEDACRKHEKKHAECHACAESCADMVEACNAYLKAT